MNIESIKLLSGSHADTAQTGHGCFMNVIAYLNGEPQITDQSPCVCAYVRPLAIRLNDRATDEQRQSLLPFVLRAMGSATENKDVMAARRIRLRQYGQECVGIVETWKAYAHAYAYANAYANAKKETTRLKALLFDAGVRYLDDVLPPAEPASAVVIERAARLVELQG